MPEAFPIVRDAEYFLEPIFIRVEDTNFQVPKQHLSHIDILSTTLSLPPTGEGLSEKCPLILHQISKQDFKAFLTVLIPLQVPYSYSNITMDEWKSTLKLSTMWDVTTLRNLAINHLANKLDPTELILLGSEYRVPSWFSSGCTKLITRSQGPTEVEGKLLGVRLTVQIYGIREQAILFSCKTGKPAANFDCQSVFRAVFPDQDI